MSMVHSELTAEATVVLSLHGVVYRLTVAFFGSFFSTKKRTVASSKASYRSIGKDCFVPCRDGKKMSYSFEEIIQ